LKVSSLMAKTYTCPRKKSRTLLTSCPSKYELQSKRCKMADKVKHPSGVWVYETSRIRLDSQTCTHLKNETNTNLTLDSSFNICYISTNFRRERRRLKLSATPSAEREVPGRDDPKRPATSWSLGVPYASTVLSEKTKLQVVVSTGRPPALCLVPAAFGFCAIGLRRQSAPVHSQG
jgi:hypothetical protein